MEATGHRLPGARKAWRSCAVPLDSGEITMKNVLLGTAVLLAAGTLSVVTHGPSAAQPPHPAQACAVEVCR